MPTQNLPHSFQVIHAASTLTLAKDNLEDETRQGNKDVSLEKHRLNAQTMAVG